MTLPSMEDQSDGASCLGVGRSRVPVTTPFVTVVMPVRNEAASIVGSLGGVLGQDYPSDYFEVIVVDGMSDDDTRLLVRELVNAAGPDAPAVMVLDNPQRIVPTGLNLAIAGARGEVIVRVDGHCAIEPDYLRTCIRRLQETGADNVGGIFLSMGRGAVGRAIAAATGSPFGVGNARFHYATAPGWVDTVPFGTWRREVFDRLGGFDEELVRNQDDEFNLRLIQAGGRIWLDPSIRIRYETRASFAHLGRQYYQYGLYKVRVIQKRRGVASWRHLVPATFVASLTAATGLALATRSSKPVLTVITPYVLGNVAASMHAGRRDPAALLLLPVAFATLHLAYGAGFLAGVWRWRHRFRDPDDTTSRALRFDNSLAVPATVGHGSGT